MKIETISEYVTKITTEGVSLKIVTQVKRYSDGHKEVVFSQWSNNPVHPGEEYKHQVDLAFVVK